MGSATIRVGPLLAVVLVVLIALAAGVSWAGRLPVTRATVTASVRAVVQLAVVSLVIVAVLRSAWLTAAFVVLMYTVASVTAGRRMTGDASGLWAAFPVAAGTAPVLGMILATGLVPARPIAVVPVAGILIGGAMTACTLTGRRLLEGLSDDEELIEARLSLGDRIRTALAPTVRQAIRTGLVPAIDQTRNVGIVTLPGTFVGLVLGGASPAEAARIQLTVLLTLLAVELLAATTIAELIVRTRIAPGERLREDVADVRR
jgi:putative ABC transport system permease protein